MSIYKWMAPAAIAAVLVSCSRDIPHVAESDSNLSNDATVQVFSATIKAARNYVYIDGTPVSGAAFAYQGVFPGTAPGFVVRPGMHAVSIKDTLGTSTQAALNYSQLFEAGKSYTIFTYDTITAIKQTTVVNKITVPTDTTSMLRFANLFYSTAAVPAVDVYSYRRGAIVFTNVAGGQVTDFIPYASQLTDTLYVYPTGATAPLLVKSFVTSLTPQRSYTSVFNGSNSSPKAVTTFVSR